MKSLQLRLMLSDLFLVDQNSAGGGVAVNVVPVTDGPDLAIAEESG